MELLVLAITWPLLVLVGGFVLIALFDIGSGGYGLSILSILWWPIIIIGGIYLISQIHKAAKTGVSFAAQSEQARRVVVTGSLAVLIPLFVRQLIVAANSSTVAVFAGLVIGFVVMIWGSFLKDHWVVSRANIIGGVLTVLYTYSQLWQLGEGMRIFGAAFGLVAAVSIAVIKFKDKLS